MAGQVRKPLKCFVISPFGEPGSDIRREADWLLLDLIRPALKDTYDVVRADEFDAGNIITNRMIAAITHADLIVAVLTGHNPNAFYELAVAHAYSRPVIPLIESGQKIPFDVGMVGTVIYSRADVNAWNAAKEALRRGAVATRGSGYKAENPITMALGVEKASASASTTDQMVVNLSAEMAKMRAQMDALRGRFRFLNRISAPPAPNSQFVTGPAIDGTQFNFLRDLRPTLLESDDLRDLDEDLPPSGKPYPDNDEPPKKR